MSALALPSHAASMIPPVHGHLAERLYCDFCGESVAPGWHKVYKTVPFLFERQVLPADWLACYGCVGRVNSEAYTALARAVASGDEHRELLNRLFHAFHQARL